MNNLVVGLKKFLTNKNTVTVVGVILAIVVWTVGVGYLLTLIDTENGILSDSPTLEKIVCYVDACASAVGIANGLFILFRYREQWIAWYIASFCDLAINIIAGQWVLLVLKVGYLTNTTYGYIKWTKYIKSHKANVELKQNTDDEKSTEISDNKIETNA